MKIRTFKEMADNRYVVDIETEDWSEGDKELMNDFGEPEINIGGTYQGTVAAIQGVVNLNEAGDHNNYGPDAAKGDMVIVVDDLAIPIEITEPRTSALTMKNSINASIAAAGASNLVVVTHDVTTGLITISTTETGSGITLSIIPGTVNDIAADTGLLANTDVHGTGSSTEVIAHKYVSIYRDSPFHYVSDTRDERYEGDAQRRAHTWGEDVANKIMDSLLALREKSDIFSSESITNV